MATRLHLSTNPADWSGADSTDGRKRLNYHLAITINGAHYYAVAIGVEELPFTPGDEDTYQAPMPDKYTIEDWNALNLLDPPDTGWQTIRIGGAEYIVLLIPHQR